MYIIYICIYIYKEISLCLSVYVYTIILTKPVDGFSKTQQDHRYLPNWAKNIPGKWLLW